MVGELELGGLGWGGEGGGGEKRGIRDSKADEP